MYSNLYGLDTACFRYFNVYGPEGEEHKGNQASPYHQFMKQAESGLIKVFEGSKDFKRDFIHVDDVFNIQMKFLDIKENGIWNVGSGKPKSFYEVAQLYNVPIVEISMPENLKNSYQSYTCADLTKLNRSLGL
jgi:ADP-L-glycero-D-manno-heptose 6-epimerase